MKARTYIKIMGILLFPWNACHSAESNFKIHYFETPHLLDNKIGYLFAHGLGATQEQASLFLADSPTPYKWLINKPLIVFDFPDAKSNTMEYHSCHVNLGQDLDIARLKESFETAKNILTDHKFILAGISRGSATLINYVALHQPDSIAALVLESPFDTLDNVIKHLLRRFHMSWFPFSKKIALKLAKSNFPLLDTQGLFPLNVIHKIRHDIPIIIIHSRKDRTIPVNSSRNLYRSLVLAGHHHVYFLELASGEHGRLIHGLESELYVQVLHAFYKKYNLPHIANLALHGENMLKHCQPTLEEINRKIKKSKFSDNFDDTDDIMPLNEWPMLAKQTFELEISPYATKLHSIF